MTSTPIVSSAKPDIAIFWPLRSTTGGVPVLERGTHSKWERERTGERFYPYATAAAKALLSHLTKERIDETVDE